MNVDPSGFWVMSIIGFTLQIGAFGGGFISIWFVFDSRGNQGLLVTCGAGFYIPQVSLTWSPFFSWRKTIYDLQGISYVAGIGGEVGVTIGADVLIDKNGIMGIQLNIGVGVSAFAIDVHASYAATALIPFGKGKLNYSSVATIMRRLRTNLLRI